VTSLDKDLAQQLEGLRDIELPTAISWWPLAESWYWLTALLIALGCVALWLAYRRSRNPRRQALEQLKQLALTAEDNSQLAANIAPLMRRLAIAIEGVELASMSGEMWQALVVKGPGALSVPMAQLLALAPYCQAQQLPSYQRSELVNQVEEWIRQYPKGGRIQC